MRNLSDKGFSPNERFSRGSTKNAIQLTNGDVIRVVADYDKMIKVLNIMIRIQDQKNCDRIMFFTLDKVLAAKFNREWVRVRMITKKPDHIYLFESKTDTYVGCVARDLEPAGDLASKTAADWKSHQDFHEMKKEHERYRQEKYNKVMDGIDQVNAVIDKAALPPETSETGGLIIPEEEKRLEAESQEECGGGVTVPEEETKSESASATEQCFEGDLEVVYVETLTDSEVDYEELEIA
ncbi:MAG: hypothetical protein IM574_01540 [Cytophagales bacterium]|jgi:hypothetical protein|nr:hypothetical protein [Cytophagales bacterium]MCA6387571.1 hypothetical protein [Cytophagales bacterium]MCA6390310.1 hypothetical protein [Cytophagales bacterium]MCA6395775.1 hypothetical protein [Cytophagales bacterium]MCA6399356.1 hypothetical protein [Cytophagales bacterium]